MMAVMSIEVLEFLNRFNKAKLRKKRRVCIENELDKMVRENYEKKVARGHVLK